MSLRVAHVLHLLLNLFLYNVTALEWRIYEGAALQHDVHGYLVKLEFYRKGGTIPGLCSGSIINNSWIITSAHCIHAKLHTIYVIHSTTTGPKLIAKVDKKHVFQHPDFVPNDTSITNREKDVGLLHLKVPIEFDANIKPIRLMALRPKYGQAGIITGYGQTEVFLNVPREGAVVISRCPDIGIRTICTRGPVRAGPGDSGGPLIYKGALVGITSAGCTDVRINRMCLTVYASVAANIDWIKHVTNNTITYL